MLAGLLAGLLAGHQEAGFSPHATWILLGYPASTQVGIQLKPYLDPTWSTSWAGGVVTKGIVTKGIVT